MVDTTKVSMSRPRISIECSERHAHVIKQYLEYGMQKKLFNILLDDLCDLIEAHGPGIIHALILGKASFKEHLEDGYTKGLNEALDLAAKSRGSSQNSDRSKREEASNGYSESIC